MEVIKKTLANCPRLCYCIKNGDDVVIALVKSVLSQHTVAKASAMLLVMEASIATTK